MCLTLYISLGGTELKIHEESISQAVALEDSSFPVHTPSRKKLFNNCFP